MLTKEEIARVDRAHRRVDGFAEQMKAGHIITECVVLYPDENDGIESRWTVAEVEAWSTEREELIRRLGGLYSFSVSIFDRGMAVGGYPLDLDVLLSAMRGELPNSAFQKYANDMRRGRVMYRESAAFKAACPKVDPYTQSDLAQLSLKA